MAFVLGRALDPFIRRADAALASLAQRTFVSVIAVRSILLRRVGADARVGVARAPFVALAQGVA